MRVVTTVDESGSSVFATIEVQNDHGWAFATTRRCHDLQEAVRWLRGRYAMVMEDHYADACVGV